MLKAWLEPLPDGTLPNSKVNPRPPLHACPCVPRGADGVQLCSRVVAAGQPSHACPTPPVPPFYLQVRGTVLRLLGQLPVDCAQEDRKEQLKRSGLGRIVMFLYKVPGGAVPSVF